jgi:hypothetical protein
MNRLISHDRVRAIHLLCEGMSIRAVTGLTGFSQTTVMKLAADGGQAAAWYQDRVFHNLSPQRPRSLKSEALSARTKKTSPQ